MALCISATSCTTKYTHSYTNNENSHNIDSHQCRRIRFISFFFASALLLSSPFVINKQYVRSYFTCELRPFLTHHFVSEFHWCKRDQQIRNEYFPFLLRRIHYILLWNLLRSIRSIFFQVFNCPVDIAI